MTIRNYRPGDETTQASIFNAAAGSLPGMQTRNPWRTCVDGPRPQASIRGSGFLPKMAAKSWDTAPAQVNGRIGFPWCRAGSERFAEPLFTAALDSLRGRGIGRAYAAYAAGLGLRKPTSFWPMQFMRTREIFNFVQDLTNLPTLLLQTHAGVSPLEPAIFPQSLP